MNLIFVIWFEIVCVVFPFFFLFLNIAIACCLWLLAAASAAAIERGAIHYERPVQKLTSCSLKHYQTNFGNIFSMVLDARREL